MNSFVTSNSPYCMIVWMFQVRKLNERVNNVHERDLRIVYKDFKSSFQDILIQANSVNINQQNLQKLVPGIFKVKNDLSPDLMNDVFGFIKKRYSLRKNLHLRSEKIRTTKYGTETPLYFSSLL